MTHLVFEPLAVLATLAALTPRPEINVLVYHAVWRRGLARDLLPRRTGSVVAGTCACIQNWIGCGVIRLDNAAGHGIGYVAPRWGLETAIARNVSHFPIAGSRIRCRESVHNQGAAAVDVLRTRPPPPADHPGYRLGRPVPKS
jgi:hypothetical protein